MGYNSCTSSATETSSNTSVESSHSSLETSTIESTGIMMQTFVDDVENEGIAAIIENEDEPDEYGQIHPNETDHLIHQSIQNFDETLDLIPNKKKQNVIDAQLKCPELLTDSFKLMFLRCECFRIDHAVKRYVKYWDKRVEAFGPIDAFQPLTLSGPLRDDTAPLELGSMQIIYRDKARNILYFDPSKLDKTKYSRESARRAFWYFFHTLLEDVDVQKYGVIILNYNANFSNSNRDPPFTKMCFSTIKGALPIRMSAIHGCHVPLLYNCFAAVAMLFIGERLRKRILVHNGTNEYVNKILLDRYGISSQHIPIEMGGSLHLDIRAWLNERRAAGH